MKIIKNMEFIQTRDPNIKKPIIIAAMQDMGNVGSIVINFINQSLKTESFRTAKVSFPTYVIDNGGYVDLPKESWEYRYTDDLIIFGGGNGQPQDNNELNLLCKDVIDIAEKYSAKFIYTLGGFHTNRILKNNPKTYITTTSMDLKKQMEKSQREYYQEQKELNSGNKPFIKSNDKSPSDFFTQTHNAIIGEKYNSQTTKVKSMYDALDDEKKTNINNSIETIKGLIGGLFKR